MNLSALIDERYTSLDLTQAITKRTNEYGLLNAMGLFKEEGITDRNVKIEVGEVSINIIPTSPIGTPAPADNAPDTGNVRVLPTFRHAKMHMLLAEELQGKRKFGSNDETESFDAAMVKKLDKIQREHRQTKEFRRWHALKGNVYDADGVKVLYNVYTLMGETQKVIEWDLDNVNAVDPINRGNDELLDYMEQSALGEMVTGVVKFCSPGYMTKMQENKAFREAYTYWSNGGEANPNRDTLRRPFYFKGVLYIRHIGQCSFKKKDGTTVTHKFIPDNEAIAVPMGTEEAFRTFFSPGETMDTVNTVGEEIYVMPEVMKLNAGVELHSFSYALDIPTKPRLVVRCTVKA
jgi:hypothetical protein